MTNDPGQFLSAAITLSPVLLLTAVLVNRRWLAGQRGLKRVAWEFWLFAPAFDVLFLGTAALALDLSPAWVFWTVFIGLIAQISASLAAYLVAIRDLDAPAG